MFSIDGSTNPSAVPYHVAYRQFFLALTKGGSDSALAEKRRRSYLNYYFGPSCAGGAARMLSSADMDKLLWVVDDLATKTENLTRRASQLRASARGSGAEANGQLTMLELERNALVASTVQSLPSLLGGSAAAKVQEHVVNHVRAHVKIVSVRVPVK